MSFDPQFVGHCTAPFYDAGPRDVTFSTDPRRFCLPDGMAGNRSCCLPCPLTQWVFDDAYEKVTHAASAGGGASVALLVFVLLSYAVLPASSTDRNYFKVHLAFSALLIAIAWIIPRADGMHVCADNVTANDIFSSVPCAFSGTLILIGGLTADAWILVKVVGLHLELCWSIEPDQRFKYWTQFGTWLLAPGVAIAAVSVSGVSFRLGPGVCHINHAHGLADYWVWLMLMGGIAVAVQLASTVFCLKHLFRDFLEDDNASVTNGRGNGATGTVPVVERIKRTLRFQWRELALIVEMLVNVVVLSAVFVVVDNASTNTPTNMQRAIPWVTCLVQNPHNPSACFPDAQKFLIKQTTISALFILNSTIGLIIALLCLTRGFFTGWWQFFRSFRRSRQSDEQLPRHRHQSRYSMELRSVGKPSMARESQRPIRSRDSDDGWLGASGADSYR
ncbi:hypothetical protein K461DRAFT_244022 [Myriangium duriaei CBS 260.36]|uniref:G-protein coupled receptors family 2 profile 2 domain-containing protein n=1 Tax=Myriangium duriaei CBS 260.36 TaxID=1168546 RepID=A0A9P4IUQ1_9PEZI|nr:hypothetical protein K461DRAFT_244022 [Myriangium duriaei CBS 260.36]